MTAGPTLSIPTGERPLAGPASGRPPCKDFNFYMRAGCDRQSQTFVAQQYTTYPFRLSRTFRLDRESDRRAYLYLMNSAPGVFGGDRLALGLTLDPDTRLYLTDQAATKVHRMPVTDTTEAVARLSWDIVVGAGACLEFVPEPLILYADAHLHQSATVTLEPTSTLFFSEILVPGRLARSEYYQFREYRNRLHVRSPDRTLLFGDAVRLMGKLNPFKDSLFFSRYPIIANVFAVLPTVDLSRLETNLDRDLCLLSPDLLTGLSALPNCNGFLIKVMGDRIDCIQSYIRQILSCIRTIRSEAELPHIPK